MPTISIDSAHRRGRRRENCHGCMPPQKHTHTHTHENCANLQRSTLELWHTYQYRRDCGSTSPRCFLWVWTGARFQEEKKRKKRTGRNVRKRNKNKPTNSDWHWRNLPRRTRGLEGMGLHNEQGKGYRCLQKWAKHFSNAHKNACFFLVLVI